MIIWFIGLSGTGKSFLGNSLFNKIKTTHKNTCFIDGDTFREIMGNDLGYTLKDREQNGWRIANVSKWLNQQDINVIVSILSNFPEQQEFNRSQNKGCYYQVYIKGNVEIVKGKNFKNIYEKRENVIGIDIPFNEPILSDHVFQNDYKEETAEKIIEIIYTEIKDKLK